MPKKRVPLSTRHIDQDGAAALPTSVVKAMEVNFGMPVTAYISAAAYGAGDMYLEGLVYADRESRFDDGDIIRTSIILDSTTVEGFLVVRTLSSLYVVCDWRGGRVSETSIAGH